MSGIVETLLEAFELGEYAGEVGTEDSQQGGTGSAGGQGRKKGGILKHYHKKEDVLIDLDSADNDFNDSQSLQDAYRRFRLTLQRDRYEQAKKEQLKRSRVLSARRRYLFLSKLLKQRKLGRQENKRDRDRLAKSLAFSYAINPGQSSVEALLAWFAKRRDGQVGPRKITSVQENKAHSKTSKYRKHALNTHSHTMLKSFRQKQVSQKAKQVFEKALQKRLHQVRKQWPIAP